MHKSPIRLFFVGTIAIGLSSCSSLPSNPSKPISLSHKQVSKGILADTHKATMKNIPTGNSAFMLINNNTEALRWRLALIDEAKNSIDLQVFIWSGDESGRLIISRVLAAAKRGVRVRLLIDDMPKDWPDHYTSLFAYQENVSIHRFNPGRIRKGVIFRSLQMLTQFRTLNRRMHNKQMIVDGSWAIVGGRNIGNPYFGLSNKYNNRDLDMILTGPLISDLAEDFDEYWNADASYPGRYMYKKLSTRKSEKYLKKFYDIVEKDKKLFNKTTIPANRINWKREMSSLPDRMMPGKAHSLSDEPVVKNANGPRLIDLLGELNIQAKEIRIITPYMIPSIGMLASLASANKNNQTVSILVPAMDSNNHTMAHSSYKKYRKRLLERGVELFEFSGYPSDEVRKNSTTAPLESKFISLHTKAFIFDRDTVLLGSLNLDPRSININTEHMIVIDSPELAEEMIADFETMTNDKNAWKVYLDEDSNIRWKKDHKILKLQPAQGVMQRTRASFYRFLPIESQL